MYTPQRKVVKENMGQSKEKCEELGKVLKRTRERVGLGQSALARLAEVPVTTYNQWELGLVDPGVMKLKRILPHLKAHRRTFLKEIGYAP